MADFLWNVTHTLLLFNFKSTSGIDCLEFHADLQDCPTADNAETAWEIGAPHILLGCMAAHLRLAKTPTWRNEPTENSKSADNLFC